MKEKVYKYICENNMIEKGDKVLVALSGGPDSVCLLSILSELRERLHIELYAAHLNHCIRGLEADEDEKYSGDLCKSLGVKFFSKKVKVEEMAEKLGISSEMAGRKARYDFFDEISSKEGIRKIAIAHNENDQAETILMRIMRGTGMDGLEGIRPVRDGRYIRPILCLRREEIESYCSERKLNPKIDKTNLQPIYSRNKVRLQLLPYIKENFNSDIVDTLSRFSQITSMDNSYIEGEAEKAYESFAKEEEGRIIIEKKCFCEHKAIVSRVIRMAAMKLRGTLNNFQMVHIDDIIKLQKSSESKEISLPMGLLAESSYGNIILKNRSDDEKKCESIEFPLTNINDKELKKSMLIGRILNYNVFIRVIKNGKEKICGDAYKRYFRLPYNAVLTIRQRRDGDRIIPYGMKGSRKIKDIFIDLKVPKEKRDKTPIVLFDDKVAWIAGYRTSNEFKIDSNTDKILEIRFEREGKTSDKQ